MPTVAIHIVTYNSAESIRACLDSVQAQRFHDFSVQVLDNASTDKTAEIVRSAGVLITVSDTNLGYAAAHNRLIDSSLATESRYVLTLNPDVWLDPSFVGAMVEALDATPTIGSAAGLLLRTERLGTPPTSIDGAGLYMRRNRRQGLRHEGEAPDSTPRQPEPIFGPDGAAAFYRRAMLDDVRCREEVFDSEFFMHKEDIDLCWRAQLRGWGSLFVPTAIAHHVRGFRPGQRGRVSWLMRFYAVRNRYLLLLKNDTPRALWRDVLPIASYELGILAYVLLREQSSLRAYTATWQLRQRMLAKRREVQSRRTVSDDDMHRWFS
jgi:GT2 family glycosyltransferase